MLAGKIEFARPDANGVAFNNIELATLGTDDAGRLLVVGGPVSRIVFPPRSICSRYDGWYDSVSDGPASATLQIGGKEVQAIPAWSWSRCRGLLLNIRGHHLV